METTSVLDAALNYCRQGWAPIPVPYRSKGPVIRGWQELRIDLGNASDHFNGKPSNIGLLTGLGGLVDIDLDCLEARSLAPLVLPPTELRHGRLSAPDSHWWYRCDPLPRTQSLHDPQPDTEDGRRVMIVEVRAAGRQTIVAPSVHPDGEPIRWEQTGSPTQCAGGLITATVRTLAALVLISRSWPEKGTRHEAALSLGGVLVRRGIAEPRMGEILATVARLGGDEEWEKRAAEVEGTERKLRTGEHVYGLPHLLDVLTLDQERRRSIVEWLGEAERPGVDGHSHAADNGHSTFTPVGELLSEPDEEHAWLVDGLLPEGGTSLAAAKPKTGKSVLVQNLAVAVAQGKEFLGRQTEQGVVLYCALEEKKDVVRRHLRRLGARRDDPLYLHIGSAPQEAMDWLEKATREHSPALIIVDTFHRLTRIRDVNDYALVSNTLEPLTSLARETGAHLLFTHHGNKAGGSDGDGVLGSTAFFGGVDTLIEMRRKEKRRTIWSIQRDGDDLEESVLEMDPETFRLRLAGTRQEADEKAVASEILEYLDGQSEPVDEQAIHDHVEGRTGILRKALRALVSSGRVHRDGAGRRGSPYRYSRFPVPTPYGERENENPGGGGLWPQDAEDSRSEPTSSEAEWEIRAEQGSTWGAEPETCPTCGTPATELPDSSSYCETCLDGIDV